MGRLDAVLRRTPASKGAQAPGQSSASELWLDKGPDKGPIRGSRAAKRPDPSMDRAGKGELVPHTGFQGNRFHADPPRSPSTSVRRMRRMKQDR
jgi:hypothetical protein